MQNKRGFKEKAHTKRRVKKEAQRREKRKADHAHKQTPKKSARRRGVKLPGFKSKVFQSNKRGKR